MKYVGRKAAGQTFLTIVNEMDCEDPFFLLPQHLLLSTEFLEVTGGQGRDSYRFPG